MRLMFQDEGRFGLLGTPRRLPSLAGGYGLEVAGHITKD